MRAIAAAVWQPSVRFDRGDTSGSCDCGRSGRNTVFPGNGRTDRSGRLKQGCGSSGCREGPFSELTSVAIRTGRDTPFHGGGQCQPPPARGAQQLQVLHELVERVRQGIAYFARQVGIKLG